MGILFSMGLMRCKEAVEYGEDHSSIIDKVVQVNDIGVESLRNLRKKGEEEVKIKLKKMQELELSPYSKLGLINFLWKLQSINCLLMSSD